MAGEASRGDPGPATAAQDGRNHDAKREGKTSLMAALCVYTLFTGPEGTSVVVAAVDQRQAELTFNLT